MELAASPFLGTCSPLPHSGCLSCVWLPPACRHCSLSFSKLIFAHGFVCCKSSCFKSMALFILQEPRSRVGCVSSSCNSARGMKAHFQCTVIDINMHTYVFIYIGIVERQDNLGTGDSGAVGLIPTCGTASLCDHQYIFYFLVPRFPHYGLWVMIMCSLGNEASVVSELFAMRTSLLGPAGSE